MKLLSLPVRHSTLRLRVMAVLGAIALVAVPTTSAAAAPSTATDWFWGSAVVRPGHNSPVDINPSDVTTRADGAVGLGYTYRATGEASGSLPGHFTYEEHGYLYFANPTDPSTMVGSSFSSGAFTLVSSRRGQPLVIADTAPSSYTSGVQTLQLGAHLRKYLGGSAGPTGSLTYGYFTFSNSQGTFTGYATPDFTQFAIQIAFPLS